MIRPSKQEEEENKFSIACVHIVCDIKVDINTYLTITERYKVTFITKVMDVQIMIF